MSWRASDHDDGPEPLPPHELLRLRRHLVAPPRAEVRDQHLRAITAELRSDRPAAAAAHALVRRSARVVAGVAGIIVVTSGLAGAQIIPEPARSLIPAVSDRLAPHFSSDEEPDEEDVPPTSEVPKQSTTTAGAPAAGAEKQQDQPPATKPPATTAAPTTTSAPSTTTSSSTTSSTSTTEPDPSTTTSTTEPDPSSTTTTSTTEPGTSTTTTTAAGGTSSSPPPWAQARGHEDGGGT